MLEPSIFTNNMVATWVTRLFYTLISYTHLYFIPKFGVMGVMIFGISPPPHILNYFLYPYTFSNAFSAVPLCFHLKYPLWLRMFCGYVYDWWWKDEVMYRFIFSSNFRAAKKWNAYERLLFTEKGESAFALFHPDCSNKKLVLVAQCWTTSREPT